MFRVLRSIGPVVAAGLVFACEGARPPLAPAGASEPPEAAHRLVIAAAACWFGGVWSDAEGEQDPVKVPANEARCHDLERRIWNGASNKVHYEQLRALEKDAVADVVARVDEAAGADAVDAPRREKLVALTLALADAEREVMAARRAADRVKRDLDHEPVKLSGDEVDAVVPLRQNTKLEALLQFDAGSLSKEGHALGLLCALDRVELARGLPRHLKLYAVADEFHFLFGVDIPKAPQDATTPLVPGAWLAFLRATAIAAGHGPPPTAATPREVDALAWAGMLQGFSDKLAADADAIGSATGLRNVVVVALHRLQAEYRAQQAAEDSLHRTPLR